MAIKKIVKFPDKRLLQVSEYVRLPTTGAPSIQELEQLVLDLTDTLYDTGGAGISAIQIGVPLRIFVLDVGLGAEVYVNPKLNGPPRWVNEVEMDEGCLSFPGVFGKVKRFPDFILSWQDLQGGLFVGQLASSLGGKSEQKQLRAQVIQHEYEHLDGILMTEHMDSITRDRVRKAAKEWK